MIKKIISLMVIFHILFFASVSATEEAVCSAASAVVCEATTGRVLYAKNSGKRAGMASTTKIMTAYCAIKYGDLNSVATVSDKAASVEGSSMYLKGGERIKLSNLIKGLLLVSGNDAAVAVAEHISKTEGGFVMLMNQTASEMGLRKTCFQNPHGLSDDEHYTTAEELAKIAAYAMREPFFAETVATKFSQVETEEGRKIYLSNHNKLLKLCNGCIGIKTGFTKAAGRCLVSCAERDGIRLICVTLNDGNDWRDHMNLYDRAFLEYRKAEGIEPEESFGFAKVFGGEEKMVELVLKYPATFVEKKDGEKVERKTDLKEIVLNAPVIKEETEVKVGIIENGKPAGELVLKPKKDIKKVSLNEKSNKETGLFEFLKKLFIKRRKA